MRNRLPDVAVGGYRQSGEKTTDETAKNGALHGNIVLLLGNRHSFVKPKVF